MHLHPIVILAILIVPGLFTYLFCKSMNGKGPEAGCTGVLVFGLCVLYYCILAAIGIGYTIQHVL